MKKTLRKITVTLGLCLFAATAQDLPKVLINKAVDHPALDNTVRGIVDALSDAGYTNGETVTIRTESSQGTPGLSAQIASKFMGQARSTKAQTVVVGVGTMPAQSFLPLLAKSQENSPEVSLIFSSVTSPESASLLPENGPISGVSNFVALEDQIKLFKKLQPALKKIGLIYNPGEANSVAIVEKLEKICPTFGLTLVKQTIAKTADASQAATKLAQTADAIFVSNDNTALAALRAIATACDTQRIPLYVSDIDAVDLGAAAALGPNQYEIGRQTGRMIVRILKGESVRQIPIEYPEKTELNLNTAVAQRLHLAFEAADECAVGDLLIK